MKKLFPLLVILLAFTACQVPSAPPGTTTGLTLVLSGEVDRSLLPSIDMNVASYTINGTNLGDATTFSRTVPATTTSVAVNALSVGNWSLAVSGYNVGGVLIGSGSTTAALLPNQVNSATVTISPLVGNGTLSMAYSWPAQVTNPSLTAKLTPIAPTTGSIITLPTTITGQTATSVVGNIPGGYYTLTVSLLQNSISVAGGADVVRIVAGQTTQGTYAFATGSLNGSLDLKLVSNMKVALIPQLSGLASSVQIEGAAPTVLSASLLTQPQGTSGPLSVDYSWYVNGVFKAKTTPAVGSPSSYSFGSSTLSPGIYRIDVLAVATDGSSGSTTATIEKVYGAQWAKTPVSGSLTINDIVADGLGNVYAVGSVTSGAFDLGNGVTGAASASSSPLIVKYSADGLALAVQMVAASNGGSFSSVGLDGQGNLIVVGTFNGAGTYNFGSGISFSGSSGAINPVIAKYSPALAVQWAKTTISGGYGSFAGVGVNSSGESVAVGYVYGATGMSFGPGVNAVGVANREYPLAVKFSASGVPLWAQASPTSTAVAIRYRNAALDDAGNSFIVGYSQGGPVTLASGVVVPDTATSTTFLAKLNASGVPQWAGAPVSGGGAVLGLTDVALDAAGNSIVVGNVAYMAGVSSGQMTLGNGVTLTPVNNYGGPAVIKYNASGVALWARTTVNVPAAAGSFSDVQVDPLGEILAAGGLPGGLWNFGNTVTASGPSGGVNPFLVKYSAAGLPEWVQTSVSGVSGTVGGLALENTNHVYLIGTVANAGTLTFGGSAPVSVTGNGSTPFVVKY